jgi:hypothetical protein
MCKSVGADALNLSGVWQGLYSYRSKRDPVPFVATLTEMDSWLTGATEETGVVGEARGRTITATLQGRRDGHSVTWLKLYDGSFRLYDAVNYAGEVNRDGTEIEGRWSIPGNASGRFLMIRSSGIAAAVGRMEAVDI